MIKIAMQSANAGAETPLLHKAHQGVGLGNPFFYPRLERIDARHRRATQLG
jgi:hypothetical protein